VHLVFDSGGIAELKRTLYCLRTNIIMITETWRHVLAPFIADPPGNSKRMQSRP